MDNIGNHIGSAPSGFSTRDQFSNDSGLQNKQSSMLLNETAVVVSGEISLADDAEDTEAAEANDRIELPNAR